MNELKNSETRETQLPSAESYKDIKPTGGTSFSDSKDFWTSEQKSIAAKEQKKKSVDDNGKEFRDGDKLKPNETFTVNEYDYKTDNKGRIISAEGQLRLKDPEYKRKMEAVKKLEGQEFKDDDDQGHLIGHQFGGSDKLENIVPMNRELNQKDYKALEDTLAGALKDGAKVQLKVEPVYVGDSNRPSEFKVSYSINGEKDTVVFKNERRN